MNSIAATLAARLADSAEAVCRHYLSQGRREGNYWLVGDRRNAPGRSLYVRLKISADGRGRPGKWTDAATGDHGDLLDIIAASCGYQRLRDTLEEARRFLRLPPSAEDHVGPPNPGGARPALGTPEAAQRLFAGSKAIRGTIAQAYLRGRAIMAVPHDRPLRFHTRCYYRPSEDDQPDCERTFPAMIAAVTDLGGAITGVHRTWLDRMAPQKASVSYPRRAMGNLLGNGVRFGTAGPIMAAGEGIETMLSLLEVMPALPLIAALSSAHLAAIRFPPQLRRLYVARDDDPAGDAAIATLVERSESLGVEIVPLSAMLGDFNDDLRMLGTDRLRMTIGSQLGGADKTAFLLPQAV
ncbi:MAG: toprim domain-containing protein [Sphingomonas sp.]